MSNDLLLNPNLTIILHPTEKRPSEVILTAPVKGKSCERIRIARKKRPLLFDVILNIARSLQFGREIDLTIPDQIYSDVQKLGILVKPGKILSYPRFGISLRRYTSVKNKQELPDCIVNPTFRFVSKVTLAPYSPYLDPGKSWVELQPSESHVASLYSGKPEIFKKLKPGKSAPMNLKAHQIKSLLESGILIHPEQWTEHRKQQKKNLLDARSAFKKDFYVALPNLFSRSQIDALASYFRKIVRGDLLPLGDVQVSRRYSQHNEPIARLFQKRLTNLVSQLAGEPVKPSYVFFGSYAEGAELNPHQDRSQCEFSISLLLDYQPVPEKTSPWPLFLKRKSREPVAVYQPIGGALLYRGRFLTHWRPPLAAGNTSTSLFLHYVRASFKGNLD